MRLIKPAKSPLKGEVYAPSDKSLSIRALILSMLSDGESRIRGLSSCLDVEACQRVIDGLGAKIKKERDTCGGEVLLVHRGNFPVSGLVLDFGNSATALRLTTGMLAGLEGEWELTGDESLRKRPMGDLVNSLSRMGARITSQNGFCPLRIVGTPLHGINIKMERPSAQVKSALLLAALFAEGKTIVREPVRTRDHTENLLELMGAQLESSFMMRFLSPPDLPPLLRRESGEVIEDFGDLKLGERLALNRELRVPLSKVGVQIVVEPIGPPLSPLDIRIPGDSSSASFLVAGTILLPGSEIRIKDVGLNYLRTGFLRVLSMAGADLEVQGLQSSNQRPVTRNQKPGTRDQEPVSTPWCGPNEPVGDISVKHSRLGGLRITRDMVPSLIDEVPILSVIASCAQEESLFEGLGTLRTKESNRLSLTAKNLNAIGGKAIVGQDSLTIVPTKGLRGGTVQTASDHRLAMAFTIAGLISSEGVSIDNPDSVAVSYPQFYDDLFRILNVE